MADGSGGRVWLRMAVDGAPAIAFLAVLLITRKFDLATWFVVGGAIIALAVSLIVERRLAPVPLVSGVMAVVFGGASLLLHDPNILKMKMTIFDGLLGAALIGGVWLRKNPLKMLLGGAIVLGERAWAVLSIRYALFFWGCAIANEIVRRTQTDTTWGMFRVAVLPAAVIFALSQTPFMMKHGKVGKAVDLSEPPRSGP